MSYGKQVKQIERFKQIDRDPEYDRDKPILIRTATEEIESKTADGYRLLNALFRSLSDDDSDISLPGAL